MEAESQNIEIITQVRPKTPEVHSVLVIGAVAFAVGYSLSAGETSWLKTKLKENSLSLFESLTSLMAGCVGLSLHREFPRYF